MRKTMEQIVLEGQVSKCGSLEELYLLWEMMQQMEEEPYGTTCYGDIDQRSFHIDGIVSPEDYDGTLYILKETNMRSFIRKGQTTPVISDVRRQIAAGKSPSGEVEYLDYISGMQRLLYKERIEKMQRRSDACAEADANNECGADTPGELPIHDSGRKGSRMTAQKLLKQCAVIYVNKRGGKGAADDISMQYGQYYIEFLKRQIELLKPKTIVCGGDDIFRLIVMEVFQNKKQKKNQEIYMKWKNMVIGDQFFADSRFKPTTDEQKAAVRVIRMWNPAYRVNNGQYVSLEEYLKEFERRLCPAGASSDGDEPPYKDDEKNS